MTPKELKRLRRSDLLEMLLELTRENEQLRRELKQTQQQLADRNIAVENCGSLAEAALRLNGLFQAAQDACDQYTENIRNRNENIEQHCKRMEQETREKCEAMLEQARQEAQQYLDNARQQDGKYLWLSELLESGDEA